MLSHKDGSVPAAQRGIGEILVSEGVITGHQLEEARRLGSQQAVRPTTVGSPPNLVNQ